MPDIGLSTVAVLFSVLDMALRAFLFVSGLLIAGHYLLMANYLRRAPHLVKALAMPALTASGVGMAACAYSGAVAMGLMFGTVASGLMVMVNLAAWASGAYVSEQFERAAEVRSQIQRDGWVFVRQYDQLTEPLQAMNSDFAQPEPTKERAR